MDAPWRVFLPVFHTFSAHVVQAVLGIKAGSGDDIHGYVANELYTQRVVSQFSSCFNLFTFSQPEFMYYEPQGCFRAQQTLILSRMVPRTEHSSINSGTQMSLG